MAEYLASNVNTQEHNEASKLNGAINFTVDSEHTVAIPKILNRMDQQHDIDTHLRSLAHQQQMQTGIASARYINQRDKLLMYQLNQYYMHKATIRSKSIAKTMLEVVKIVHDVLRELEIQEPRFISTFTENNGHYDGSLLNNMRNLPTN